MFKQLFILVIVQVSVQVSVQVLSVQVIVYLSKIKAVIPGCEPGVEVAEDIAEELQMPRRNSAETTMWRRHKFDMQERLRECGIRAIRQIYSKSVAEVCEWQRVDNKGWKFFHFQVLI